MNFHKQQLFSTHKTYVKMPLKHRSKGNFLVNVSFNAPIKIDNISKKLWKSDGNRNLTKTIENHIFTLTSRQNI